MSPTSKEYEHILRTEENVILLENTLQGVENTKSYLFIDPIYILQAWRISEILPMLTEIQDLLQKGYYAAGYFTYECGYFIDKLQMTDYQSTVQPLAWFGIYRQPHIFNCMDMNTGNAIQTEPQQKEQTDKLEDTYSIKNLCFDIGKAEYVQKIEKIREYIRAGDVYQVNFTGRYGFHFSGSALSLYTALKNEQNVSYGAYIHTENQHILSYSPELFFHIQGDLITARPMKGTASRGQTSVEDIQQAHWLQQDIKNRAENVMIVDLLRNDLGQICQIGSVNVPQLFNIEKYKTLFQMTSTIEGTLQKNIGPLQLFESLFPCGSVTGAPKIRAMEIIKELERSPRGVYTGSIGYFAPEQNNVLPYTSAFNVAIRTIVIKDTMGEMGIGSGIVYDSTATNEYKECNVKALFLKSQIQPFKILESILWEGTYHFLQKHLDRLAKSAAYFDYPYDERQLRRQLVEIEKGFLADNRYKVRIELKENGDFTCDASTVRVETGEEELVVAISAVHTHSQNLLLQHKTTERELYEKATHFAQKEHFADVLFMNEKEEITEGAISNIFIKREGYLITPPLSSGLLGGIYRQYILENFPLTREGTLYLNDLLEAEEIYICNAIRGLRKVTLNTSTPFSDM